MNKEPMIKNKFRLSLKLFIIVWIALFVHILLKLTFNYWQPYVIPNEQLQIISNFIDNNRWIRNILDGILYVFNGVVVILTGIQCWWFKSKKQSVIVVTIALCSYLFSIFVGQSTILTLILNFAIPIIINKKKWFYVILTFILNNLFLLLSLWLCGFSKTDNMPYVIQTLFLLDYYILMVLNYFVFNLFKKERD